MNNLIKVHFSNHSKNTYWGLIQYQAGELIEVATLAELNFQCGRDTRKQMSEGGS